MSVEIGTVATFPDARDDKAQLLKMAEELMEVYSAWEDFYRARGTDPLSGSGEASNAAHRARGEAWGHLYDELCDLIQATANMMAGLGVEDCRDGMERCRKRNEERGRL